jgi:hypothetical protein
MGGPVVQKGQNAYPLYGVTYFIFRPAPMNAPLTMACSASLAAFGDTPQRGRIPAAGRAMSSGLNRRNKKIEESKRTTTIDITT